MTDVDVGAGCLGSSAPDTASETYDDDEAGAGCLGSSAPDTASDDDKTLGPVYVVAVLPILPVILDYGKITGAGVCGSCAPDAASGYWGRFSW